MKSKKIILFDLDGTLTDPKEGITKAFAYALKKTAQMEVPLDELTKCIGPPLKTSFETYFGFTEETSPDAINAFRAYFEVEGWRENILFDGIKQMLETLKSEDKKLYIATSKATIYAEKIIEYFELNPYFEAIIGSNLDGTRTHKDEVIAEVLHQIGEVDKSDIVMVGDREHDVIGAKKQAIDAIGVTYGYGSKDELIASGADVIVDSITALHQLLK